MEKHFEDDVEIDKQYLDKNYETLGFIAIELNSEGSRGVIKYGNYTEEVAKPPVIANQYKEKEKLPMQVEVTVVKPYMRINPTKRHTEKKKVILDPDLGVREMPVKET